MYQWLVATYLLVPLIGVFLLELGSTSPDLHSPGYPNGATLAFAAHLLAFSLAFFTVRRCLGRRLPPKVRLAAEIPWQGRISNRQFLSVAVAAILIDVIGLAYVLFVVGAVGTLTKQVNRGDLRTQAGILGYFCRDFLFPATTALVAMLYRYVRHTPGVKWLLGINLLSAAFAGAVWGYRGLAIILLYPAAVVLVPRLRLRQVLALAGVAFAVLTLMFSYYDGLPFSDSATAVFRRTTVQTGSVPWRVWTLSESPDYADFLNYRTTFLNALGGNVGKFLDIYDPGILESIQPYDYSGSLQVILFGIGSYRRTSNLTGTVFTEGIIAFGRRLFLLFSLTAGAIVATHEFLFTRAMCEGAVIRATLLAVYFKQCILAWLDSGSIVVLFHLAFIVSFAACYFLCFFLLRLADISVRPLGAKPWPRRDVRWRRLPPLFAAAPRDSRA